MNFLFMFSLYCFEMHNFSIEVLDGLIKFFDVRIWFFIVVQDSRESHLKVPVDSVHIIEFLFEL